jgi:hypothetical protein
VLGKCDTATPPELWMTICSGARVHPNGSIGIQKGIGMNYSFGGEAERTTAPPSSLIINRLNFSTLETLRVDNDA